MAKFTKLEDYQQLLNYILEVCGVAVANNAPVTPVALTGRYEGELLKDLTVFDLRKVQKSSVDKVATFVKSLTNNEEYDFVAYICGGGVTEETAAETAFVAKVPADSRETVVTLIYSDDCQAFAHHQVDRAARKILPGELAFVGEGQLALSSAFLLPTATRH